MFGSKNSGQLRYYLAALGFVWAAAIAGIASADANKVTICHFPPGNPANYQQIRIDAQGLAAHLAHGDFIGSCASDCNVNQTLCNTPPDSCHQAGTCVTSTGLCQFPLQPDFTACTGMDGLSCDSCQNGACISVSSCAGKDNNFDPFDYCAPVNGGTCTLEVANCPSVPSSIDTCYRIGLNAITGICEEACRTTSCGDGGITRCSNVVACTTNADCGPQTIGSTGLPNKCVINSCDTALGICSWQGRPQALVCPPGDFCDPAYGCYAP